MGTLLSYASPTLGSSFFKIVPLIRLQSFYFKKNRNEIRRSHSCKQILNRHS